MRKVVISVNRRPKKNGKSEEPRHGDEKIEFFMGKTDAYEMDGKMQESYVHEVPEEKSQINHETKRISVIFRSGRQVIYEKDSGKECLDLSPRDVSILYLFGEIDGLEHGKLYSRTQLRDMKAHGSLQRGISGNKMVGCSAIVVSGARKDCREIDTFDKLTYVAEMKVGAGSILKSMEVGYPIRVFRSSNYDSPHAPKPFSKKDPSYRYDGLYEVVSFEKPEDENAEPFIFKLRRFYIDNCTGMYRDRLRTRRS